MTADAMREMASSRLSEQDHQEVAAASARCADVDPTMIAMLRLMATGKASWDELFSLGCDGHLPEPNRHLFLLGQKAFGETWCESYIRSLDPAFVRRRGFQGPLVGKYDLVFEGSRVEVKSARAINSRTRGSIASRALCVGSPDPFFMNFQRLRPEACDAFVWVGVWLDEIRTWVLSAREVMEHPRRVLQLESESQFSITPNSIATLDPYRVDPAEVAVRLRRVLTSKI